MERLSVRKRKFLDYIDFIFSININRFYIDSVVKATGLTFVDAEKFLMELVEAKELDINYEIRCPEYACGYSADFMNISDIPFGNVIEDIKGHTFIIDEDNIYPYFTVLEEKEVKEVLSKKKFCLSRN